MSKMMMITNPGDESSWVKKYFEQAAMSKDIVEELEDIDSDTDIIELLRIAQEAREQIIANREQIVTMYLVMGHVLDTFKQVPWDNPQCGADFSQAINSMDKYCTKYQTTQEDEADARSFNPPE